MYNNDVHSTVECNKHYNTYISINIAKSKNNNKKKTIAADRYFNTGNYCARRKSI